MKRGAGCKAFAPIALIALAACHRGDGKKSTALLIDSTPVPLSAPAAPVAELAICLPDFANERLLVKPVSGPPVTGALLLKTRADLLLSDPGSPFPPGTRLLALYELTGGQWVADLSGEARRVQGSSGERWAVLSLVNTLALGRTDIQGVRLLIDGQPNETLGHLDLAEPFAPTPELLPEGSRPS